MVPLPDNTSIGYIDYAAVTKPQKREIDKILLKEAKHKRDRDREEVMQPDVLRSWLEEISYDNCGRRFIRMHDMQCGGTYDGYVCLLHIVSIVEEKDLRIIADVSDVVKLDETTYVQYVTSNIQDPHIPYGTVVFRGYPLGKDLNLTDKHINLLHTVYPKGGMSRKVTDSNGFFQMFGNRQGSENNRSMGQISSGSNHSYYDASECDESLATHLSPTINSMSHVTRSVQETSGQIETGTIEAAFRQDGDQDISSVDICPYNISTGPRRYPRRGYGVSFSNSYHKDGDTLNKEQTHMVMKYIESINCPQLEEYIRRKQATFKDVTDSDKISLPTTCAWKQRERPEDYAYIHNQHFIVAEAGVSFNLSSYVYDSLLPHLDDDNTQSVILGATFFGSLIGHLTSTSMYEVEGGQGATTLMPGNAAIEAWGSSGKYRYLSMRGRARTQAIIGTIRNHRLNQGRFPRHLPGVNIDQFLVMGGRNGNIPRGWAPGVLGRGSRGRGRGRGPRGRGRGPRGRGRGVGGRRCRGRR